MAMRKHVVIRLVHIEEGNVGGCVTHRATQSTETKINGEFEYDGA